MNELDESSTRFLRVVACTNTGMVDFPLSDVAVRHGLSPRIKMREVAADVRNNRS